MYCDGCELNDNGVCSKFKSVKKSGKVIVGCGCVISSKIRSLSSECPRGLWKAETGM